MNWIGDNAAAIQAVSAAISTGVTAILVWLTSRYVKLTRELSAASQEQAKLLAQQAKHLEQTELYSRKRKAATLREVCRRVRITSRHLNPKNPAAPVSRSFTYLDATDPVVVSTLAADVSVQAAKDAGLVSLALRTVVSLLDQVQSDHQLTPSLQQVKDWEGALETLSTDIPKVESACDAVLTG